MECPSCKKKMELIRDSIKQDNVEFEAYKCKSCGEELLDMTQLKSLANKYRKLRMAKEITFTKWGNSIAVRIPKEFLEEFKIESGKHGLLTKEKDGIKITPSS